MRRFALLACTALAVAACSGAAGTDSDTADASGGRAPQGVEADVAALTVRLLQGMSMAELATIRSADPRVREVALATWDTQRAARDAALAWLEERGVAAPAGDATLPGTFTADQMNELAAKSGREFDSLFLQRMVHHHRSAMDLAERVDRDLAAPLVEAMQVELQTIECVRGNC